MACYDPYTACTADHVREVSPEMLVEVAGRPCPKCDCRQSRPVESDVDDYDTANLPLRVCDACNEVFGFDDSTSVDDCALDKIRCASDWNGNDDGVADGLTSSPWFRDPAWSSGNEDAEDRNHERQQEFHDAPRRGRGRGKRSGSGGCGHRSRGHHEEDSSHYCHKHHHGHRGRGHGRRGCGGRAVASSNGSDPWQQVACTCLQSSARAIGAASHLAAGRYDSAVATLSDEMEPVGRAVGSAFGSAAGDLIGSPRAGEIGAGLGSTVGRGVAEMLKESSLCCNQRCSSHRD